MGEKRLAAILGPLVLAQGGQLCTYREWELDGYGVVIRAPTGQEFRIWRMLWPRPGLKQCPCYLTLQRFTLGLHADLRFRPEKPGFVSMGCAQSEGKPL